MNIQVNLKKNTDTVLSFRFLVADGFSLHSLTSAIAPLTVLNRMFGRSLYSWSCVSEQNEPVHSECGFKFESDPITPRETSSDALIVCDGINGVEFYSANTLKMLRLHAATGRIVGSFGNGGYALAQAGLLSGKRFTIHWAHHKTLTENYPFLEPSDRVFEIDRNVMTSAGGLAAMDLTLALISRNFGASTARQVAEHCLYTHPRTEHDTQRAPLSAVLDTRNQILINAVQKMRENLEFPLELDELAVDQGVSRRQLERLFRKYLNRTPGQYYKELRLQHARRLLHETDLPVAEIAFACGYNSISSFGKGFRSLYGTGPQACRENFRVPESKSETSKHLEVVQ